MTVFEGGYSTDRKDPGNFIGKAFIGSNRGISAPVLAAVRGTEITSTDMKNLSKEEGKQIAKQYYWDHILGDNISNQNIANSLADHAFNSGTGTSLSIAQNTAFKMGANIKLNDVKSINSKDIVSAINSLNDQDQKVFNSLFNQGRNDLYGSIPNHPLSHYQSWYNRTYENERNIEKTNEIIKSLNYYSEFNNVSIQDIVDAKAIDGKLGPSSQHSITQYQISHNLTPTSYLDDNTKDSIYKEIIGKENDLDSSNKNESNNVVTPYQHFNNLTQNLQGKDYYNISDNINVPNLSINANYNLDANSINTSTVQNSITITDNKNENQKDNLTIDNKNVNNNPNLCDDKINNSQPQSNSENNSESADSKVNSNVITKTNPNVSSSEIKGKDINNSTAVNIINSIRENEGSDDSKISNIINSDNLSNNGITDSSPANISLSDSDGTNNNNSDSSSSNNSVSDSSSASSSSSSSEAGI